MSVLHFFLAEWYSLDGYTFVCPFISWWTFGLSPCFAHYEYCRCEHPCICFCINVGIYLGVESLRHIITLSWIFIGRTDTEAEAPTLWLPELIGKDPDAGKDWRQKQGVVEDEMVGWHHGLNGHQCEKTPGDSEGLGSLACCSPWDRRVRPSLATEQQWF